MVGKGTGEEKERKEGGSEKDREGGRVKKEGGMCKLSVSSHKGTNPILRIPSS